MKTTQNDTGTQDVPPEDFLSLVAKLLTDIEQKTKKHIDDERMELWLALREQVVSSFLQHQIGHTEEIEGLADLLSNLLLDIDSVYRNEWGE